MREMIFNDMWIIIVLFFSAVIAYTYTEKYKKFIIKKFLTEHINKDCIHSQGETFISVKIGIIYKDGKLTDTVLIMPNSTKVVT